MSDCEQCAALQRQIDLLANDRDGYVQLLTNENNKLRAEVERLKALAVKADEAIARQQQDLEGAADQAADCDILRAENEKLRQVLENTQQARVLQGKAITDASNEIERLRAALIGVLWMAEEWFKHGGDETTFADEYEAKLEAARAAITKGEHQC